MSVYFSERCSMNRPHGTEMEKSACADVNASGFKVQGFFIPSHNTIPYSC